MSAGSDRHTGCRNDPVSAGIAVYFLSDLAYQFFTTGVSIRVRTAENMRRKSMMVVMFSMKSGFDVTSGL